MTFQYIDPGDGRLLAVSKTVFRCNHASRTGVAFCQTQKVSSFNIPELANVTEAWLKFDMYVYSQSGDSSKSVVRVYWLTSDGKTTGLQMFNGDTAHSSVNNDEVRLWVTNSQVNKWSKEIVGLHKVKMYVKSHASSGVVKIYIDDNSTPFYTYTGNVHNGEKLGNLQMQGDNHKILFSNIIISSSEPSLDTVVSYTKAPYKYVNIGTTDGLTVSATAMKSTAYSKFGTSFYQTTQPSAGIFGVPPMDEVWIKFDLYHRGSTRFRCYANSGRSSGICLRQNTSDTIALFLDNTEVSLPTAPKCSSYTIQTYVLHMKSGGTANSCVIDLWIGDVKVIDGFTQKNSVAPFEGLYVQSDNNDNLFSNIVISDNQEALSRGAELVTVHADIKRNVKGKVEYHADTDCLIDNSRREKEDWRYTDPGDGRLFTGSISQIVGNSVSRTGTAVYLNSGWEVETPHFNVSEIYFSKDVWIKFDAYIDDDDGNNGYGYVVVSFESHGDKVEFETNNSDDYPDYKNKVRWGDSDDDSVLVGEGLAGFLSFKMHVISDATNGLIEIYVDDDTTPFYSHTGNINQGNRFSDICIYSGRAVVSNVVISNLEPSINEVIPYQRTPYKYENIGVLEGLKSDAEAVVIESSEYSHTGTALEIHYGDNPFDIPIMDEVWMKFDYYRRAESGYFWFGVNVHDMYCGLFADYWGELYAEGDGYGSLNGGGDTTLPRDTIHHCIIHVVTVPKRHVEVWIDGEQIIDNKIDYISDLPSGYRVHTDYGDDATLISNIVIADNKDDVWDELPEGYIAVHHDIDFSIKYPSLIRYDIKNYVINSTKPYYKDPGIPDTGYMVLGNTVSRTGVGTVDVYDTDITQYIKETNAIWVKLDVFAWNEKSYNNAEVEIKCLTGDRTKSVAQSMCCGVTYTLNDLWNGNPTIEVNTGTKTISYRINKKVGFHIIKVHFVIDETDGLIECFLDNYATAAYTFRGQVGNGEKIASIMISSMETIHSNVIISESEPDINEIVPYSGNPCVVYANKGYIEQLSQKIYKTFSQWALWMLSPTGATIQTTTKSRTGVGFYQTELVPCLDIPRVDEMWLRFDLYHHGETRFYCLANPQLAPMLVFGDGELPSKNIGFRLKEGTTNQIEVVVESFVCTPTIEITPDIIQTYLLHLKVGAENTTLQLWIDDQVVMNTSIDRGVGFFNDVCLASAASNEDNIFSNIAFSNDRAMLDAFNVECHADIVREVTANSSTPEVWRYENPGVIDGKLGTDSDTQYWNDEQLLEVHNNTISRTGTAIMQKDPDSYPHLYYILPDEMKGASELWFKFDWCICSHGGYEFPYLWHGVFNLDINGAGDMRVLTSEGEVALVPDGRNVDARMAFDGRTWQETTISFDVHSMMFHYIFGDPDGIIEIYLDDDNTPIHIERDRTFNDGYVSIEVADIAVSNIIISNVKPSFSEVVGQSENPPQPLNTEGIATHKTIDLGSEMTVGIGIVIDGEGYAMIRTAGQDMNFTEWENYIPCERLCRYIDIRLHVRDVITQALLTIDRSTVSKTISKHLLAGENTVNYGEAFYNVPAVIPTAIGDGMTAHVISKGKESCVIKITDSNEEAVEGDVDVLIRGW